MARLLLINGPNLNLLGTREPDRYGSGTLADLEGRLAAAAIEVGHELDSFQSNAEDALVDHVQQAADEGVDFILINPAAFTHTSVALRDALAAVDIPFIEIHITNIHAREPFRQQSYFSDLAVGCISGLGQLGYDLALRAACDYLSVNKV